MQKKIKALCLKDKNDNACGNPALTHEQFFKHMKDFIFLQSSLQTEFANVNSSSSDWNFLTDIPRLGEIYSAGARWDYIKHGQGAIFTNTKGVIVDIHDHILEKNVVDAQRMNEYILSLRIRRADDEDRYQECSRILHEMESSGVIYRFEAEKDTWRLV